MTVSVVIPTRGLVPQIAPLVSSLRGDGIEIVLGAATRDLDRVAVAIADIAAEVRIVTCDAVGAAAARNAAATAAAGDTLVFVDDDMTACEGLIDRHRDAIGNVQTVSIGRIDTVEHGVWMARAKARWLNDHYRRLDNRPVAPRDLYSGNFALSRTMFSQVGGFDTDWPALHDTVLGLRLAERGARFMYTRDAITTQRIVKTNLEILDDYVAIGRQHDRLDRCFGDRHGVPDLGPRTTYRDSAIVAACSVLPSLGWRAVAEATARWAPHLGRAPDLLRSAAVRRGQREQARRATVYPAAPVR